MSLAMIVPPPEPLLAEHEIRRWMGDSVLAGVSADEVDQLQRKAVRVVETLIHRTLMITTYRLTLDRFQQTSCPVYRATNARGIAEYLITPRSNGIHLKHTPLHHIESVIYRAEGMGWQPLPDWRYTVKRGENPQIVPADETDWPATEAVPGAVEITYCAGYGVAEDVPQEAKNAVLSLMKYWLESNQGIEEIGDFPRHIDPALRELRRGDWRVAR